MSHTKEPWAQSHRRVADTGMYATEIYDSEGKTIATLHWYAVPTENGTATNREANARRIVACVNACAGIPTYQLTAEEVTPTLLGENIDALRKQRDELVAQLERSTKGLKTVSRWNICDDTLAAITTQIIANESAIASVKGGA